MPLNSLQTPQSPHSSTSSSDDGNLGATTAASASDCCAEGDSILDGRVGVTNAADSPSGKWGGGPLDAERQGDMARAAVEGPRHAANLAYAAIVAGLSVWSIAYS